MPAALRVLICPDKFKGTLTAREAARAMAQGVCAAAPALGVGVEIDECPLADGGEGTARCIGAALGADFARLGVTGPLGRPVDAEYAVFRDPRRGVTLLFDSAEACGLKHVGASERDPERTTSRGVGELLLHAKRLGVDRVDVGLGGSATVDGGLGMAAALGWRFIDAGGVAIERPTGADLARIDAAIACPWTGPPVRVLCDVESVLCGAGGAAVLYGPQKGATPEQVTRLDAGLAHVAAVIARAEECLPETGAFTGAAGGLAFGLRYATGAELTSGAQAVAGVVGLSRRVQDADLVLTGEGRLDATSLEGKAVGLIGRYGRALGRCVIVIAGSVDLGFEPAGAGFAAVRSILSADAAGPAPGSRESAARLEVLAGEAFAGWVGARR